MNSKIASFTKKHALSLFLSVGLVSYILVMGTTGKCGTCETITAGLGIPSLALMGSSDTPASAPADADLAPAWQLLDLDGQPVSSADFAGKVVFIDFWATWCPPCRQMIPGLVELHEAYADQGLVIVGVSLDRQGPEVVRAFNEEFGVDYTSLMGDEAIVSAFGGIEGIPTSFLIDREGRIVEKHVGYVSKRNLQAEIEPLL
jgi:thiol-disulfide isomerase/thioredoxin